jgi:hypothetical protein
VKWIFLKIYKVYVLKIIIIIIGHTLSIFSVLMWQYHNRSWKIQWFQIFLNKIIFWKIIIIRLSMWKLTLGYGKPFLTRSTSNPSICPKKREGGGVQGVLEREKEKHGIMDSVSYMIGSTSWSCSFSRLCH